MGQSLADGVHPSGLIMTKYNLSVLEKQITHERHGLKAVAIQFLA